MIVWFTSVNIFITASEAPKHLLNICLESASEQSLCQQPPFPGIWNGRLFHAIPSVFSAIKQNSKDCDFNILYLKSTQF